MRIVLLHKQNLVHVERFATALRKSNHEVLMLDYTAARENLNNFSSLNSFDLCVICPIFHIEQTINELLPRKRVYFSMAYDLIVDIPMMSEPDRKILIDQLQECKDFICDSEHIKSNLIRLIGDTKRILVIPYGIDLEILFNLTKKKSHDTSQLNIAALRNWNEVHEQPKILDSIELLYRNYPNIRLHIAGQGPDKLRSAEKIKNLTEKGILIDHGSVSNRDLINILAGCHIYISNARVDGSSITLLEAMYLKCLCLVPNIPGNETWVINKITGLTFKEPIEALKKSIELFNSNSPLIEEMITNSHNKVKKQADWTKNSRILVSFICGALSA
jgi:glycosyltransferase involved in cell wall biosynthesis